MTINDLALLILVLFGAVVSIVGLAISCGYAWHHFLLFWYNNEVKRWERRIEVDRKKLEAINVRKDVSQKEVGFAFPD